MDCVERDAQSPKLRTLRFYSVWFLATDLRIMRILHRAARSFFEVIGVERATQRRFTF